jgi:hypothetical protein
MGQSGKVGSHTVKVWRRVASAIVNPLDACGTNMKVAIASAYAKNGPEECCWCFYGGGCVAWEFEGRPVLVSLLRGGLVVVEPAMRRAARVGALGATAPLPLRMGP